MNSRERLMCALNHKEPDRVPLDIGAGKSCKFTISAYKKLLDHFGLNEEIQVVGAFNELYNLAHASDTVLEKLGCDVRVPLPNYLVDPGGYPVERWEDDHDYYLLDQWGTKHRMPKDESKYYSMVSAPLEGAGEDQDQGYKWPSPVKVRPEQVEEARKYHEKGYPVTIPDHYSNGFLQAGPNIYGYQQWLTMLAGQKKRAEAILDKLLELKIQHWDNILDAFGDTIDVISECDDLGAQNSTIISPSMFRKVFKPYWKKLYDHIRGKTNAKIFMHSCGSIYDLLPDLIEVGVEIINPVQIGAANMNPALIKKEFGKDISFWGGGINTQDTLPLGTVQQVKDEVKRNLDIFKKDGGFVFATIHNLQGECPIENVMAMLEAYQENCAY